MMAPGGHLRLESAGCFPDPVERCGTSGSDRQIAESVAAAGGSTPSRLGLRVDRVVVRVLDRLRRFAEARPPRGVTVLLTLTAPIRAPGKTAAALEREVEDLLQTGGVGSERSAVLYGNRAELRLVEHAPGRGERLVGLVHNPNANATHVLNLAGRWLREAPSPP